MDHQQIVKDIEENQKSNDTEDRFDTIVYGPFSMTLAHFFIRCGISANTVTFLSLVFGLCGSVFFYSKNTWINFIGMVIEFIAVVLDCADGQVARMTNTSSQLGRFLDGTVDITNFFAIYFVLGLRMMNETVPFTGLKWSWAIFAVLIVNGYCHGQQARMADYYRGLHLNFLNQDNSANFTTSQKIKAEIAASKDTPFYNRLYLRVYYYYTRAQERMSPNVQKLLKAIDAKGGVIPKDLAAAFTERSRRYIQLTNTLTFNLRAYVLYLLILLKLHPWFIPFNIIVLGGLMFYMISRYEKIAKDLLKMI